MHWNPGNSIYGDNPVKWNDGYDDALGLNSYTYVPSVAAIRQSGNLYAYGMNNPVMFSDPNGQIAITTLILIGSAVIALIAAGYTAYQSDKHTGSIDWQNTITMGLSWFVMAYTLGMSAYGVYLSYCDYRGMTPVTEANFNSNAQIKTGNAMLESNLKISINNLKHITNRHHAQTYAKQLDHKPTLDVVKELQNKTFFNSSWSTGKINAAVNYGYNSAVTRGIENGTYITTYSGEQITIILKNGLVDTAYGNYTYSYEYLMNLGK